MKLIHSLSHMKPQRPKIKHDLRNCLITTLLRSANHCRTYYVTAFFHFHIMAHNGNQIISVARRTAREWHIAAESMCFRFPLAASPTARGPPGA